MSLKNLFSCEVVTPRKSNEFLEKKQQLSTLYEKQKVIKHDLEQLEEDIQKLIKLKEETLKKNEEVSKEIIKIETEGKTFKI
jgi:peptidoglycan hydrolase CwlO-like protein